MAQIHEKQKELPDDVGEDFSKAESFHRMHAAFERDITALGKQVQHRGSAPLLRGNTVGGSQKANFDDSYPDEGENAAIFGQLRKVFSGAKNP